MAINPNMFIHESDKAALQALKSIPGFTPFLKAFMKVWDEKQARILNMSTNLRLSESQMSKYYNMLPPICEKLGIDVPELYLELNVHANAYTSGDTNPYIVITSGLLETMPDELIPTILAHECGHIACHHVLYSTMGQLILNETISFLGIDNSLISLPLKMAFFYWMRCSEYSADRAATICDGSGDKLIEACFRFAGYDKDISADANLDAFMEQARDYRSMITDSKWNRTLEFLILSSATHPLNAVRAFECNEWQKSEKFAKIKKYLEESPNTDIPVSDSDTPASDLPLHLPSKYFAGKNYEDAANELKELGFTNIHVVRKSDKSLLTKPHTVVMITINGDSKFGDNNWYPSDVLIEITYYEPLSDEEVSALRVGKIQMPNSSKYYTGKHHQFVIHELMEAGFKNVLLDAAVDPKKIWFTKEGYVANISVEGQHQFSKGDWFDPNVEIIVTYRPTSNI